MVLHVGAAKETIDPTIVEKDWTDSNDDHEWQAGEAFVDVNNNGKFDAVWIAGFGNGRPATSIHDSLWARALAFRYNNTTVVFVTLDLIGYFKTEMDMIRARVAKELGIDLIVISSTHVHESPDTIGIWGETEEKNGTDPAYLEHIRVQSVKAIEASVRALAPAQMTVAQVKVADPDGKTTNWARDGRDPVIIDTTMTVMRFAKAAAPAETIASWVIWASHPEFAWSSNNAITSDFPYGIRETLETRGFPAEGLPALGGMCLFSNGPLGGLIGPGSPRNGIPVTRADGSVVDTDSPERAELGGAALARFALKALGTGGGAETIADAPVRFRTWERDADIDNYYFHTAGLLKIIQRTFAGYDETQPITRTTGNIPKVLVEFTRVEIGPVGFISMPGEMFPEFFVGFDPMWAGGAPMIAADNPNPPDLGMSFKGPFLKDLLLMRPGIKYAVGLGMTQDYLGYIVPTYDFELSADDPYFGRPPGDHYEETLCIGPLAEQHLVEPLRALLLAD